MMVEYRCRVCGRSHDTIRFDPVVICCGKVAEIHKLKGVKHEQNHIDRKADT